MLTLVLIVLAVASTWVLVSVLFAFLAGGVIHARDHRDAPSARSPRSGAAIRRSTARFTVVRSHH